MEAPTESYFDIIFFAILAAAILYKLFTVLGKDGTGTPPPDVRPGDKKEPQNTHKEKPSAATAMSLMQRPKAHAQVIPPIEPEPEIADAKLAAALAELKSKDPNFTINSFLGGAKTAFEMLIKALQEGDKTTLKNLLSAEVYKDFASELERREKSNKFPQITLVSISQSTITEAVVSKAKATISVEFTSEQIHVVRDSEQKIIGGDASSVDTIIDNWTFERDLRSGNPNWTIIAT